MKKYTGKLGEWDSRGLNQNISTFTHLEIGEHVLKGITASQLYASKTP